MTMKKCVLTIMFFVLFVMSGYSAYAEQDILDLSQDITIIKGKDITLDKGNTKTISVKNIKAIKGNKIKFSSSKKNVVRIVAAKNKSIAITGEKPGTATVSITTKNVRYEFNVKVKDPNAVDISANKITISQGKTKNVYLKNYDRIIQTYKNKEVHFYVDDSAVASIKKAKGGTVTLAAKGKGKTKLTIKTSKHKYHCHITVK